jgi:hypothetical protein
LSFSLAANTGGEEGKGPGKSGGRTGKGRGRLRGEGKLPLLRPLFVTDQTAYAFMFNSFCFENNKKNPTQLVRAHILTYSVHRRRYNEAEIT